MCCVVFVDVCFTCINVPMFNVSITSPSPTPPLPVPFPVEPHCGGPAVCPPGHVEWSVCILLEQVVCLHSTRQTTVCDESSRVGGRGRGRGGAGGENRHLVGGGWGSDMYRTLVFGYAIYQCCENSVRPPLPPLSVSFLLSLLSLQFSLFSSLPSASCSLPGS